MDNINIFNFTNSSIYKQLNISINSLTQTNNNTEDNIFYNIEQVPLYKPRKCILKTTNGALYLTQNMKNKEECIIKQLKPTNDGISHVLLKEITLLHNMNHKHVIKMKEIFLTPEHNTCIVFPNSIFIRNML